MGWDHSILTDSGGYQVFSLAKRNIITDDGVSFKSHLDGSTHFLGPREAMDIQRKLGSDIMMVFDECPPHPCKKDYACQAVKRTLDWATICKEAPRNKGQLTFGIVQGGVFSDLREFCAKELIKMDFEGYAIGGVSVGEPDDLIIKGVQDSIQYLPFNKPRYLMGVGEMAQMIESIALGVDMFDCVLPTRLARNGTVCTRKGRYPVKAAVYANDKRPLESGCSCYTCKNFTRSYVRHLLNVKEILSDEILLTLPSKSMFIETTSFPTSDRSELTNMAQFYLDKKIPLPNDKMIFDNEIISDNLKESHVLLGAAQISKIDIYSSYKSKNYEIKCIDSRICGWLSLIPIPENMPDSSNQCLIIDDGLEVHLLMRSKKLIHWIRPLYLNFEEEDIGESLSYELKYSFQQYGIDIPENISIWRFDEIPKETHENIQMHCTNKMEYFPFLICQIYLKE